LDLQIVAIALSRDARLLTANARDFGKAPGFRAENWLTA
jgi:predicted nucleic acid-binding protein